MPAAETTKMGRGEEGRRAVSVALSLVFALCVGKILYCWVAPEVLSGPGVLRNDLTFLAISLCLSAGGLYYLHVRDEKRLALCIFLPAFFFLSGIASYRTQYILFHTGREFPLIDAQLAAGDRALGFDWTTYFLWVVGNPALNRVFDLAYASIWIQPLVLSGACILRQDLGCYARLQLALPLSFVLVCLTAFVFPALGAYQFHHITPDQHPGVALEFTDGMTRPLLWLRQDSLPSVLPSFPDMRLVTFPSWHAAAAVIFILSAWSHPVGCWFSLALNAAMIAATPVQGSHYLTDIILGAGLGAAAFLIGAWCLTLRPLRWCVRTAQPAGPDRAPLPGTSRLPAERAIPAR